MAYKGGPKVQKVMVQPIRPVQDGSLAEALACWYPSSHYWQLEKKEPARERFAFYNHYDKGNNLIFRYLQNRSRVQIWLYEQTNLRVEGVIAGFDEYMNLVLDEAEEVHMKTRNRKNLATTLKMDEYNAVYKTDGSLIQEVASC